MIRPRMDFAPRIVNQAKVPARSAVVAMLVRSRDGWQVRFRPAQTRQGLSRGGLNIIGGKFTEDEEASWVGMSTHGTGWIFRGQHMKRGMFEGMIAACFENKGKIQNGI